jgi:hypothetical protein
MDSQKAFIVIGITLVIVILLNLAIYAAVIRRKDRVGEVDLIRRAMKRARDPWKNEKADLQALSKRVAELQGKDHTEVGTNDQ